MNVKITLLIILPLASFASCNAQINQDNMKSDSALQYIVRESKVGVVKSPLLVLLHGHGSNENDLFALNTQIPQNWTVVSIRAPYKLAENNYRWYDVKLINGKILINLEQEEFSRRKLLELIADLTKKYRVDSSKIVIAGFSQGANMSQSLGLSEPNLIAGFGVFSGRYVEEFAPFISKSAELNKIKAFLSHGSEDNMLPITLAEENLNKLKALGIETTYCEDVNGHSISNKQWKEFTEWLLSVN